MNSRLFKNIVLATDGSDYSAKAITYAIELARISNARIHIIYVVDTGAFATIPMDAAWENMYELLTKEGHEVITQVGEQAKKAGIEVESIIKEGHPAEEIIKYAENISADIIVMGTLGKAGLDKFLLGSVAEKVSKASKIPVLVVRGEKTE